MKRTHLLLCLLVLLCLPTLSLAQAWSGIIDPSRAINWSNAGIPGGIPNRTVICATLNPGATSAKIDAAIASCPANGVVYLNAGTYSIASGISFNGTSNVTLRGAGPEKTILDFTGGDSCGGLGGDICAIDSTAYYVGSAPVQPGGSNATTWSAGYTQGSTQITLSNTSGLSVGSTIILDQANDTTNTGGVFVCDASNCHQGGETGSANGRTIGGVDYNQTQIVAITAITGNVVTISPGLYMTNWRAPQTPGSWWPGQINQDSVEDMTVDNSNSGTSVSAGIYFYDCYECWIKNIKSIKGNRNHVWLYQSARDVVRDSYFYGTQNGAEESYGIEMFLSSDDLLENNIFDMIASPIMGAGTEGSVVGYNYSINNYYNVSPAWMQLSYASHDAGNSMDLYEGNQFNGISCDDIHGTSNLQTYFRNELTGWQTGKTEQTVPLIFMSYCRGYNVIGNVLGTPAYHTQYQVTPSSGNVSNCDVGIYNIGMSQTECGNSTPPSTDPLTPSTMLRWGNYDVVNSSVQWNSSEIPTSGVPYIKGNPVPSTHTLPASLYLSSQPAFWHTPWGTTPWPPVGPDVTGGTGPGGYAYAIPAQLCYNNTAKDGNGILLFDASACYLSQSAPDPPGNLNAVVH